MDFFLTKVVICERLLFFSYFSHFKSPKHNLLSFEVNIILLVQCSSLCYILSLCNPVDYSPPGSSVHGISQARIQEWVAISSCRASSQPKDQTHISVSPAFADRFFTTAPTPGKFTNICYCLKKKA